MTNWLTGLRLDSLDSVCLSGNSKRTHDESSESEQWQRPVLSSLLLSTRWLAYKKEISSAANTDSFAVTMVGKGRAIEKSLLTFSSSTSPHFLQWTPSSYCVFTFFFVVWCIIKKETQKTLHCLHCTCWLSGWWAPALYWERGKRKSATNKTDFRRWKKLCVCDVHDQQHSQRIMTPAPLMTTFWPLTATIIR